MTVNPFLLFGLFELLSLFSIIWVWRKDDSITRKILWSLISALPLVGPIFLLAFFNEPTELPEHLQNKRELDVIPHDYGTRDVNGHHH